VDVLCGCRVDAHSTDWVTVVRGRIGDWRGHYSGENKRLNYQGQ